ncbi:MAG: hypothetical protein ACRCYY_05340 [Trueperaceae bacterium]
MAYSVEPYSVKHSADFWEGWFGSLSQVSHISNEAVAWLNEVD